MFWTAFIWGLGVTLGGSFGLMAFVILYFVWDVVKTTWLKTETGKRFDQLSEAFVISLQRQNERTAEQNEKLDKLAESIFSAISLCVSGQKPAHPENVEQPKKAGNW